MSRITALRLATLRSATLQLAALLVAALLVARPLAAQTVSGAVTGTDQRPAVGAVVELLDSTYTSIAHEVTSTTGAFVLRAPKDGAYVVRARRIGWRPVYSSPLALRGDVIQSIRLVFARPAFALDTVRVDSRTVCSGTDDSTSAIVAALEYARTALMASEAMRSRGFTATSMRYERLLDPIRERVVSQESRFTRDAAAQPWISVAVDSLRRFGYVVGAAGDSTLYRLPGLDMLSSAAFVDDHCFQFSGRSDRKRMGVAFEPTDARRRVADIRGTIWLDRKTGALQSLDFRYTNLSGAQDDARPGGTMHFDRLRDGTWTVSQWAVRMPVLERRLPSATPGLRVGSGVPEIVVAGIRVSGGQIASITAAGVTGAMDTLFARPGLAVRGAVLDSIAERLVPGARVSANGTGITVSTDSLGRFTIPGLIPGDYTLSVRTPSLDSVRASSTFPLSIEDGESPSFATLKVANAAAIVSLLCPASGTTARGVLVGAVHGDSIAAAANARVAITWDDGDAGATRWLTVRADSSGAFRVCGVPLDREVRVSATTARTGVASSAPVTLRVPGALRFASAELTIDRTRLAGAVFTGTIVADSAGRPVADAEVALPALSRSTRSNADGQFRIDDIPAGAHRVLVRRLGLTPVDATLSFAPGDVVDRRVVLGTVSVIDSVVVRADAVDPSMRDFEEHRALGIGHFLTRADLDKLGAQRLAEVLSTIPGVSTKRLGNMVYLTNGRRDSQRERCFFLEGRLPLTECTRTTECFLQVYLDRTALFVGRNGQTVPDVSRYLASQLESIEVYTGAAQIPTRYAGESTACGLVVLRGRRGPASRE